MREQIDVFVMRVELANDGSGYREREIEGGDTCGDKLDTHRACARSRIVAWLWKVVAPSRMDIAREYDEIINAISGEGIV